MSCDIIGNDVDAAYHTDRKVIVDDGEWHWISFFRNIGGRRHFKIPSIHHHHFARLYLMEDLFDARALVTLNVGTSSEFESN